MAVGGKYQVQKLFFQADQPTLNDTDGILGRTFALTFKSQVNETFTTMPIEFFTGPDNFHDFILDIQSALKALPNQVIDDIHVAGSYNQYGNTAHINITFVGNNVQGPQNLITVRAYQCGDGCTPKLSGMILKPTTQNVTELQTFYRRNLWVFLDLSPFGSCGICGALCGILAMEAHNFLRFHGSMSQKLRICENHGFRS
jgi:hypothetical protein